MPAAPTVDVNTIIEVLTTPGVQDTEIRPAADADTIRGHLATPVDPDATVIGVPYGSTLFVQMTTAGARRLAEAGVDDHAYEDEQGLDLTTGEGNLYGQMALVGGPAFAVQLAVAPQGSALFDVLSGCHALDKTIETVDDGTLHISAAFDY